jgi:ribonuclease P protein component
VKATFPKELRLRSRRDYQRMAYQFKRLVGNFIIIYCKENQRQITRLGITVSRKFGKAHERNRFKRVIREAYRLCHHDLPQGLDLNIRPRTAAHKTKPNDVIYEFFQLIKH